MQIWGLLLTRLALVILVCHSWCFSQYDIIENFDPENSLPESDLIILSTAGSIYHNLTPESAVLLSQLSFLTEEENNILDQVIHGNTIELTPDSRLFTLTKSLWSPRQDIKISGTVFHRINKVDDVQYKWSGEFNIGQFTMGVLGERDPYESNILDYNSFFIRTNYKNFDYTIGSYQMLAGHGLVSWRPFPVKSDFGTTNSAFRQGRGIQPFRSGHESWAYRGLGWNQIFNKGQFSGGISHRKIDGSIVDHKIKMSDLGLHVSDTQINNHGNVSETIGIGGWESDLRNGKIGIIIGGGSWYDKNENKLINLVSSFYGNYRYSDLSIFSEVAFTSQNKKAVISGAKLKKDSFQYGIVLRHIDLNYFAIRDNMFRNWSNTAQGEFSFFQELRIRIGSSYLNIYSDIFERLLGDEGEFEKTGNKTGISLIIKPRHRWQVRTQLKYQESSSDTYGFEGSHLSSVPVSTFKTTIKWSRNSSHNVQFQILKKSTQENLSSSWGLQVRNQYDFGLLVIKTFWMSSVINENKKLYYWDLTLPGEMRTKVFSDSGHYLGMGIGYKPSTLSMINFRVSSSWNAWNFNALPIVRAAMQVNLSI